MNKFEIILGKFTKTINEFDDQIISLGFANDCQALYREVSTFYFNTKLTNSILYPELVLLFNITLLFIFSLTRTEVEIKKLRYIYILFFLVTYSVGIGLLFLNRSYYTHQVEIFANYMLISDFYSFFCKIFILLLAIGVVFCLFYYLKAKENIQFEYFILFGYTVCGLLFLVSVFDFMSLYITIECISLALYVLTCYKKNSIYAAEAAIKYFTLGAFASGILLFGIFFIYSQFTFLNFLIIRYMSLITFNNLLFMSLPLTYDPILFGVKLGVIFILIGFLFKIAAAPFHMWAPDVYEGAPLITTIFFAIVVKTAIFLTFLRVLYYTFFFLQIIWQPFLFFIALCSLVIGCLGALYQKRIKRFLAYGSINHVGFLLLGVATGKVLGLTATLFYLITYIVTLLAFFLVLIQAKTVDNKYIIYLSDLRLFVQETKYGYILALLLFSMAGIPPLLGFFAKFLIFKAVLFIKFYEIIVFALIISLISTFYYLRLIKIMFFEQQSFNNLYKRKFKRIESINFLQLVIKFLHFLSVEAYFSKPIEVVKKENQKQDSFVFLISSFSYVYQLIIYWFLVSGFIYFEGLIKFCQLISSRICNPFYTFNSYQFFNNHLYNYIASESTNSLKCQQNMQSIQFYYDWINSYENVDEVWLIVSTFPFPGNFFT